MKNGSKQVEPFCYYCDKMLNESKGELAHGCLDCHGTVYQERIDDRDRHIKKLEAENEKLREFYYIVKKYQAMSTYAPEIIDDALKQLEGEK